jgi:hypothetical protein
MEAGKMSTEIKRIGINGHWHRIGSKLAHELLPTNDVQILLKLGKNFKEGKAMRIG